MNRILEELAMRLINFSWLIIMLLAACGDPHSPPPQASESVVGNGGNVLAAQFRLLAKSQLLNANPLMRPSSESSKILEALDKGRIPIVFKSLLRDDDGKPCHQRVGYDAKRNLTTLELDEGYWEKTLNTKTRLRTPVGEDVLAALDLYWQSQNGAHKVNPLFRPDQTVILLTAYLAPKRGEAINLSDRELEERLETIAHTDLLERVKHKLQIIRSREEVALFGGLERFLAAGQFKIRIVDEESGSLTDAFGTKVSSRIPLSERRAAPCESSRSTWTDRMKEAGDLDEAGKLHLFHEVMRLAFFQGWISVNDDDEKLSLTLFSKE